MRNLKARILGGAEVLIGAGLIISVAFAPEMRDVAVPFYACGSLVVVNGSADLISGRSYYLIEKAVDFMYNTKNRYSKKRDNVKAGERFD